LERPAEPQAAGVVRQIARDHGAVIDPRELYEVLPSVSFDTAVMEKTAHVVAVPAAVGWSDVGSWAAIPEVRGADETGNTIVGQAVMIDGTGNVLVSDDDMLIATVGVSDLVVVKSGNAILIVRKDQAQRVREVVEVLGVRGFARYL
jgi:mannose-1-phosphate guanylyltransferase